MRKFIGVSLRNCFVLALRDRKWVHHFKPKTPKGWRLLGQGVDGKILLKCISNIVRERGLDSCGSDGVQRRAPMSMAVKLRVPWEQGSFLTS
jgi:hypothetical protein